MRRFVLNLTVALVAATLASSTVRALESVRVISGFTLPSGLAVTPDGTRLYVANDSSALGQGLVSVVDTATNTRLLDIPVQAGAWDVAVRPDGRFVYVSCRYAGIVQIDAATNTVASTLALGGYPKGLAMSSDGTRLCCAVDSANALAVVDCSTPTMVLLGSVPVGQGPVDVAFKPNSTRAYVVNARSNNVTVVNTAARTVVATIAVGTTPKGVAARPNGNRMYVTNNGSGTVTVIDTMSGSATVNRVIGTLSLGSNQHPEGCAVDPGGAYLYAANFQNGLYEVTQLHLATGAIVDREAAGRGVGQVATNPAGTRLYASAYGSGDVDVCTAP